MTKQEELYISIGQRFENAEQSQMFGKPCFKINRKAFICFFRQAMVFKLPEKACREALKLSGSQLFDPSGKNRPMKEWVQVSCEHCGKWEELAQEAIEYVCPTNQ